MHLSRVLVHKTHRIDCYPPVHPTHLESRKHSLVSQRCRRTWGGMRKTGGLRHDNPVFSTRISPFRHFSKDRSVRSGENILGVAEFDEAFIDLAAAFLNFLSPRGGYLTTDRSVQTFNKSFRYERSGLRAQCKGVGQNLFHLCTHTCMLPAMSWHSKGVSAFGKMCCRQARRASTATATAKRLRYYIRTSAEAQTKPDPNATRRTVSPGFARPAFLAWSRAIGRQADAMFP